MAIQEILKQLRADQKRIAAAIAALEALDGDSAPAPAKKAGAKAAAKPKRRISAAGRKRISEAAKARWAKIKAGKK